MMAKDDLHTYSASLAGMEPAAPVPPRLEFQSLDAFRSHAAKGLGKGPFCVLIVEDRAALSETLRHLDRLGFQTIFFIAPREIGVPADCADLVTEITVVRTPTRQETAAADAVNAVIPGAGTAWIHYCYNAEFFFFPFSEERTVGEVSRFVEEERRASVLTYVVDLYAKDLTLNPDAVNCENAFLDSSGYFAESRSDENGHPRERQLNFYGGLRWRFEEHIPTTKRRIDRIGLFQAQEGLTLRTDHTLSDEELNTYACPWHNSLTAAIVSFRVAKALRSNPGSRWDVPNFVWHRSVEFEWSSEQLMHLGLMEPGQWF